MPKKMPDGTYFEIWTDPIMAMMLWAEYLEKTGNKIIIAGIGKPTYPLFKTITKTTLAFWKNRLETLEPINYTDPKGEPSAKKILADAFSTWYGRNIRPDHVLPTVGGAGAIFCILKALKTENPLGRILTPKPYYTLYRGLNNSAKLHFINVLDASGHYRLTAYALEQAIKEAAKEAVRKGEIDGGKPHALLLCDPSNPLGTVLSIEEKKDIIAVLRKYPDIRLIVDEAYAEMILSGEKHTSFLSLLANDDELKQRTVVMRSGTKGLSAAGERMAAIVAFDRKFMDTLTAVNINTIGHPPISGQIAFAAAMDELANSPDILKQSNDFYYERVAYIYDRIRVIGVDLVEHTTEATFYVPVDLKELIGTKAPASLKIVFDNAGDPISTDEELAYSILLEDGIQLAPMSYFGISAQKGLLRITCSGDIPELKKIMDVIERRIVLARVSKNKELIGKICSMTSDPDEKLTADCDEINEKLENSGALKTDSAAALKEKNKALNELWIRLAQTMR